MSHEGTKDTKLGATVACGSAAHHTADARPWHPLQKNGTFTNSASSVSSAVKPGSFRIY